MKFKIRRVTLAIIIVIAAVLILFKYKEYEINSEIKEIGKLTSITLLKDTDTSYNIEYYLTERLKKSSNYNLINFIKGCIDIEKGNDKEAIKNLEAVIARLNGEKSNNINDYLKVYSTSMLAQLYYKKGNLQEASNIIFMEYSTLDYNTCKKYENVIWNTMAIVTGFRDDIVDTIDRLDSSNGLSNANKINILRNVKKYYIVDGDTDISQSSAVRLVILLDFLSAEYIKCKTLVDIGNLFSEIEEYEKSVESINYVLNKELENKYENAYIKTDAYIKIASIYLQSKEYDKAEESIQQIDKYIGYYTPEDYRDVEILSNVIKGEIYLSKGEINKAEDILAYSQKLLDIDKEELYPYKKELLILLQASLLEKQEKYYETIGKYYEILASQNQIDSKIDIAVLKRLKKAAEIVGDKDTYNYAEDALNREKSQLMNLIYTQYSTSYIKYIDTEKAVVDQNIKINIFNSALKMETLFALIIILWAHIIVKKINKTANSDYLTKINNRQCFDRTYKNYLKKKIRFAAIMIDIDNFKKINDSYGHEIGDKVLRKVCALIKGSDYQNTEVFRYGGEEIVALVKYRERKDVEIVAENIRMTIENIIWKENIKVTASLGVAYSEEYGERTLGKADDNLYQAKNTGKNKVVYK